MKKLIGVAVLIVMLYCAIDGNAHVRVKRKVLFTKNSKFFLRLNGKANVIPWVQIFAQGWAFRVNWDLPETLHRRHTFFKREIANASDDFKKVYGYSCILKYVCYFIKSINQSQKCGIFCEIGKIISRSQGVDVDLFQTVFSQCQNYEDDCPLTAL